MSITHLLEDFTTQASSGAIHLLDDDALEEQRLTAFENGYGAGWDDAVQAQDQGRQNLSAELTSALSDLPFTYHEALTRMTLSLEPMFQSLVQIVLPEVVLQGFGAQLVAQLCEMAKDQISQPILLRVPPGASALVTPLMPENLSPPPKVIEDPSLEPGQAQIQVGTARREVDCAALLTSIAGAFDAYIFEAKEVLSNE